MNFKEQLFLQFLIDDCYLAIIAVGLVVLVVIISHGLSFSISLIAGMLLSIGVAFFIYVVNYALKCHLNHICRLSCRLNSFRSSIS
jgi:hypothetical protein